MSTIRQQEISAITVIAEKLVIDGEMVSSIATDIALAPSDALVTAGAVRNLVNDSISSMQGYVTSYFNSLSDTALANVAWVLAGKPIRGGTFTEPSVP